MGSFLDKSSSTSAQIGFDHVLAFSRAFSDQVAMYSVICGDKSAKSSMVGAPLIAASR